MVLSRSARRIFSLKGRFITLGHWRNHHSSALEPARRVQWIRPVSYTHLDVYKRQQYCGVVDRRRIIAFLLLTISELIIIPYHIMLDVYKRQNLELARRIPGCNGPGGPDTAGRSSLCRSGRWHRVRGTKAESG